MPRDNIYDLVRIDFGDKAEYYARPIGFNETQSAVILINTTCPNCGSLVEKDVSNIVLEEDSIVPIQCEGCGFGTIDSKKEEKIAVIRDGVKTAEHNVHVPQHLPKSLQEEKNNLGKITVNVKPNLVHSDDGLLPKCPFVDPVELGLFNINEV